MSAIFGIVRHDGGPVSERALGAMRNAMGRWGPDGAATWLEKEAGLGHLMLRATPESGNETMPLHSKADGLTITAAARLDNRGELFDALGTPAVERPGVADTHLILACYRKWGRRCVERLLGDWSFAVWDTRDRSLFLARDHFGNTGLYHYAGPGFSAFASSVTGLLALADVPRRPDPLTIAKLLVSCPLTGGRTCYEGIHRLPPAHSATITSSGVALDRYWRMEDSPDVRLGSDAEYVEAFLDVYGAAVRARVRSRRSVAVLMSGGLDSTSVAALAAPEVARGGRRLVAFCHVPSHDVERLAGPGRFGDEAPFVEMVREHIDNLDVRYLTADDVSPIAGLRRGLAVHGEPHFAAGNYFWITSLLEAACRDDVGALLTGQGGNFTISWTGNPDAALAAWLARGRLLRFWREMNGWRRRRGLSLLMALRHTLVRPMVPVDWVRRYKRLKRGGEPWREYSAINRDLAKSLDLTAELARCGHDPTFTRMEVAPRTRHLHPQLAIGTTWNEVGGFYGLEVRDPTWDKRVVSFCLGTPEDQFARDGRDRLLLRTAMQDLLPEGVVWNRLRGRQAADVGRRLLEHGEEMEATLRRLESSSLAREYLNLERMRSLGQSLHQAAGPSSVARAQTVLLDGLAVGLFLCGFETGSPAGAEEARKGNAAPRRFS